ncbi:MAG: DUF3108 domain-containing protein [gamma proteobacterium symbiont of Bathyaustriella thionipta]|nr:DUF3108 domain-containing protein [gamma proteobacterium symbiont of Bathyaustriella thionipta]
MTALLYLCLNSVFASEPGLRPFIASYRISHLGVPVGHAQMQLSYPSAGFYQIDFSIQPNTVAAWMGVNRIVESSQGEISQNQIVPQQYHYHLLDTAEHPVKSIKVVFDRKKKRVITHINTDHWSMSIPAHTQDKLSVRIAMLMRLSNDQRNGRLPVADGGKLKYYQFHDQGSSLLQTLIGSYPAIKLELRKPGEARPTYSWVAETLDYIPLRIERPVKEHYLLLELESLEFQDLGKVTPR